MQEMQQILGSPLDLCVEKILENTTRFYYKEENRVMGVLYPWEHLKKRFPKPFVCKLKETFCTDTIFYSNTTSMIGYNCFQLFSIVLG